MRLISALQWRKCCFHRRANACLAKFCALIYNYLLAEQFMVYTMFCLLLKLLFCLVYLHMYSLNVLTVSDNTEQTCCQCTGEFTLHLRSHVIMANVCSLRARSKTECKANKSWL